MLRSLSIHHFILVEHLEIDFFEGFGVLTGETGAGKSILLDALGLCLGARAGKEVISEAQTRTDISCCFDASQQGSVYDWLQNQQLYDKETLLLRRTLDKNGKSKAWINGIPVNLSLLRELGQLLVDIHGQHAHQKLLLPEYQRNLLDSYGDIHEQVSELAKTYHAWKNIQQLLVKIEQEAQRVIQEQESLTWQVQEIATLDFQLEQWEALNAEHKLLANGAEQITQVATLLQQLEGEQFSVYAQLQNMRKNMEIIVHNDPLLSETQQLLTDSEIAIEEVIHTLRRYQSNLELDPQRLQIVEEKIAQTLLVARKYQVSPEELPELLQQGQQRLQQLQDSSDPEKLKIREKQAEQEYLKLANRVSQERQLAAQRLSEQVSSVMQSLAMSGGSFRVDLQTKKEASAHGLETAEFQICTHAKQGYHALASVASGGELSRIGLAIQVIASQQKTAEILIFDEVDVGIGGKVAEIVGRLLRQLAQHRQVLCVTHLPQVAACAQHQWLISKQETELGLQSHVKILSFEDRVEEIARMLGGVKLTETTRKHAQEMLLMHANLPKD